MPTSSLEVFDDKDDPMMETGSDDTAVHVLVYVCFTMEQAHAHINAVMHRLVKGQIYDECVSEETTVAMAVENPNFITEQYSIYEATRAQAAAPQEQATTEVHLHAIASDNNASCASFVPLTNFRTDLWDDESANAYISIVQLTSTDKGQGADSFDNE
ncbi:Hydroxymethylglutaryl-CoA lyase, mitochondrial [Hordeum vulgare]|nr:Hydroxymethylglutaryl-CoA lyase, mitochondrial [Hordeum vulgare]